MTAPAPGPWTVESTNANGWKGLSIRAADGTFVANLVMQPGKDNERANARLMAAAPLMAEVLMSAYQHISHGGPRRGDVEDVLRTAGLLP